MRRRNRMPRYVIPIVLLGIIIFSVFMVWSSERTYHKNPNKQSIKSLPTSAPESQLTSVFVPYWQFPDSSLTLSDPVNPSRPIDQAIYFAVSPNASGALEKNSAYIGVSTFEKKALNTSLLTLKMTDEQISTAILRDTKAQDVLIHETISLAQKHSFSGIILDLEHSVLPFKDVRKSITRFTHRFSTAARASKLTFAMTLYGDTYFRARPYDVSELEPHVDAIYIMAYDFHKSFGQPGPNFPFSCSSDTYPYCFTRMLEDFLTDVPPTKITIVYGLYGYTWNVDTENRPDSPAKARTYAQLKNINTSCPNNPCTFKVDSLSAETTHSYSTNGRNIITWFETPSSIEIKSTHARSLGIHSFAYWAFGYY